MSFALVCERLCALAAGPGVPGFGYLRANAAGSVVAARHIGGLAAPRYAAACPLWALFRAQQVPESVVRQRVLFPDGNRFVFVARAGLSGPVGFGRARHYLTDMLVMTEDAAASTVYAADGFVPVEPVGIACRSCARRDCIHRVADPLGAESPGGATA
ncbi:MAG: short-chain fatty acyl-CoA regulator family protein [Pseudomonadota bacterium]